MEYAEEYYDNGQIKRRGAQVNTKEVVKTKKGVATSFPDGNLMLPPCPIVVHPYRRPENDLHHIST